MPSKRISRKFSPQPSHGRGRRDSRPNVFIQPEKTDGNEPRSAVSPAVSGGVEGAAGAGAVAARRPGTGRARAGSARASIFTRTLDKELRLISILAALAVVAVIALKFILE